MAHLQLSYAYRYLANFQLADAALEKAKAFSGKATEKERLYIEAAYARRIERDPDKQLAILREIAAKYPKEKEIHEGLTTIYRQKKMYPEAIAEAGKGLELDPEWPTILNNLGYLYMATGDLIKAEECLKKAVSVAPEDANPRDSLGELYFRSGRLDESISSYKEAVRIRPDFGSEDTIAYIFAVRGDYAEAMSWLDQFILATPSKSSQTLGYWWKAMYDHVLGKREQARVEMERVEAAWESIRSKSGTALAKMLQAYFYLDRGMFDPALKMFADYREDLQEASVQSERAGAIENELWLGLCEWKQGRIQTANQKLDRIRSLLSGLPGNMGQEVIVQLEKNHRILQAEVWLSEGKAAEAASFLEKEFFLQIPFIEPVSYARLLTLYNFPLDQDVLGRAYQQMGNLDKAIEEYGKLLAFDPASQDRRIQNPVYHYRLAKLYEQKGMKEEAKKEYGRFLQFWKDADPGLAELVDAKKRFAQL
jgi:tetratricopeptide (TPR) repeat protein